MSKFPERIALGLALGLLGGGLALATASERPDAKAQTRAAAAVKSPSLVGLGRIAHPDEIAAWDIDIRPDGKGLPPGKGSVKAGEELYMAQCAVCHGEFGESAGRWPALAGGQGSLKHEQPDKTIGSFWPYASTTFDYIRRAMPYGNARSLSDDEVYAITAYVLYLNDVVKDDFVLGRDNFTSVKLPNQAGFYMDDRETTERMFWTREPCMSNCAPEPARVLNRARSLDVTPEGNTGPKVE